MHAALAQSASHNVVHHSSPMTLTSNHILLIAHAPLAQALLDCAQHVFADSPAYVSVLDVPAHQDPETTLAQARALLSRSGAARTLVMTDVFGATPSNVAQRLVEGTAARMLVGVNVPMLLRAICYRHLPLDEQVARALVGGQQGMLQVGGGGAPRNQNSRKEHAQDRDHDQQ